MRNSSGIACISPDRRRRADTTIQAGQPVSVETGPCVIVITPAMPRLKKLCLDTDRSQQLQAGPSSDCIATATISACCICADVAASTSGASVTAKSSNGPAVA